MNNQNPKMLEEYLSHANSLRDAIPLSCRAVRTRLLLPPLRIFDDAMNGIENSANGEIR